MFGFTIRSYVDEFELPVQHRHLFKLRHSGALTQMDQRGVFDECVSKVPAEVLEETRWINPLYKSKGENKYQGLHLVRII